MLATTMSIQVLTSAVVENFYLVAGKSVTISMVRTTFYMLESLSLMIHMIE